MLARNGHQDHHQRVEALVGRWLEERQALISAWSALQGAAPDGGDLPDCLEAFCEILMDYVSAGHFEVYDELIAEAERLDSLDASGSQALLERLRDTTDAAIRFNDLCDNPRDPLALVLLPRELPILALELESRFQTEDRLLAMLHDRAGVAAPDIGSNA